MPYCVTLRSRTDARITGWYAGGNLQWSTDHTRQKLFDNPRDAAAVCDELRDLCPRNAPGINIELAQHDQMSNSMLSFRETTPQDYRQ